MDKISTLKSNVGFFTTNTYIVIFIKSMLVLFPLLFVLTSCTKDGQNGADGAPGVSCRGVYYERDAEGVLHKYNEYYNSGAKKCFTDPLALSRWETLSELWNINNTECVPQPQFASRSLVSANNHYAYRDGKIYLDFDSSTGVYRKVTLGESKFNGEPTFTRLQGCFYQRTGVGVDAGFGNQILLDTDVSKLVTSEDFDAMEIFKYSETAISLEMTRFDDSGTWDYTFCPELNTSWGYCDLLRNGNIMYYPNLTVLEQEGLLSEALLIRRQFNFDVIAKSVFETVWANSKTTHKETGRNNWKYMVVGIVDTPRYIDQAWRDYVKGERPYMPDVNSGTMPFICYQGRKSVILPDGTKGSIRGEICYENGTYKFMGD
jgi:hypothetical protein